MHSSMKKILIIGRKSFLGSNLKIYLSKFYKVDCYSYEKIILKSISFFDHYSHIINTTIHKSYINKKYNIKYDLDRNFLRKFLKINFYYIYLNSRKIYSPKENIIENSHILPIENYARNKIITERFLKKKCKGKFISLRISNVIGRRIFKNLRNNHKLFFDNFLQYRKNKKKIIVNNDFKDFISINQFSKVIKQIIKYDIKGIYNVSIGQKVYISEIVQWLDKNFLKNIKFVESKKDSFTLSNKKLLKKIKIDLSKNQLKLFCKKLI